MRTWLWQQFCRLIPDDLLAHLDDEPPAADGDGWIFCTPLEDS